MLAGRIGSRRRLDPQSKRRLPRRRLLRRSPAPEPVALVKPAARAAGPFAKPRFGEWTVADVERLLAEHGDAFPEQREELEIDLDSFRSVAAATGGCRATSTS